MTKEIQTKIFIYFIPIYYIYCMFIDVVIPRGGIFGLVINIGLLLFLCHVTLYNRFNKKFWYVFAFIGLNLFLIICNSSNWIMSFTWFTKIMIGLMYFPLSFYLISGNDAIVHSFKMLLIIMALYLLNLFLANTLGWGNSYGRGSMAVQGGASIVTGSMPIVIALMMMPSIFLAHHKKELILAFGIIVFLSIFLIFKRTNIASTVIGYFIILTVFITLKRVYNVNVQKMVLDKKSTITYSLIGLLFLIGGISLFGNVIVAQYEIRARKFNENALEKEGRVIEWELVKNAILKADETQIVLFGKEPYNTPGNYGFPTNRNIHGDFSLILFSSGLVGSIFYWTIQLYIAFLILKYIKREYIRNIQDVLLVSAYIASSTIWALFSYSAASYFILISCVYYMIHGMILRYFWNREQRYKFFLEQKNENINSSKS